MASLIIGNYIFRRRRQLKDGSIITSCNGCEAQAPKTYLSAIALITEDGTYELVEEFTDTMEARATGSARALILMIEFAEGCGF